MTLEGAIASLSELDKFSTIYARQPCERESACDVIPMDEEPCPVFSRELRTLPRSIRRARKIARRDRRRGSAAITFARSALWLR